jgi:pyruvate/2-oxoglutarate dehydrogenase complex dihydrolipoamide dehydrogenase (E3) component
MILEHDDERVTSVLLKQLEQEGIRFLFNAEVERFNSATEALIKFYDG